MEEKCANTNQKLRGTEKWRNLSLNIQIVHALQLRNFQHRFAPALRRNLRYSGNFFAFRRDSLRWTRNRRGRGMWGFDARKSILTAYCSSGIPLTAALPAPLGRKAPPDGEFLRFHPRFAPLDSRVIFYGGRGKTIRPCLKIGGMPDWGRFFCQARRFDAGVLAEKDAQRRRFATFQTRPKTSTRFTP